jgi:Uma2 family endonuclease
MSTQPKTFLTPEQYLEIERKAEFKSEYYNGEMFAMAGGSPRHAFIIANIMYELVGQLKGRPSRVASSQLRLRVLPSGLYTYPDVMVICGGLQYADDRKDTVVNPVVIIEVLSESTRDYDRGQKFEFCRGLSSLREYVTIAQTAPHIEHWTRQEVDTGVLSEFNDLNQAIHLASINCVLKLSDVYDKVDWTTR